MISYTICTHKMGIDVISSNVNEMWWMRQKYYLCTQLWELPKCCNDHFIDSSDLFWRGFELYSLSGNFNVWLSISTELKCASIEKINEWISSSMSKSSHWLHPSFPSHSKMSCGCISLPGIHLIIGIIELEVLISVAIIVTTLFATIIILPSLNCAVWALHVFFWFTHFMSSAVCIPNTEWARSVLRPPCWMR